MKLRRTKDLKDFTIAATDADIGSVHDLLFDDHLWTIRYIVLETGDILSSRKVLISPLALRQPSIRALHIWVNLSWKQVDSSPAFDPRLPVSRQHEISFYDHYRWPYYWEGSGVWGSETNPYDLSEKVSVDAETSQVQNASANAELRSAREVEGYHVVAQDGEIGHVEDFLFDDDTWEIRYAIVDTRNWWPGKKVLLRPMWIKNVSWTDREIFVDKSRETIRNSPEWDANQPVSRKYELHLHKYYESPPYWTPEE